MDIARRYCLIFLLCLLASGSYAQNLRVTTLRATGGLGAPNLDATALSSAVSAGATAINVLTLPVSAAANRGYVVIEPFSTNCEIRQIDTIVGTTINIIGSAAYPLNYAHSSGTTVMWISGGDGVPWTWFGAKRNDTSEAVAAANTWGFNRLSTNLYNLTGRGPGEIVVPSGTFRIANQLWLERDLAVRGISPNVSVIAAADSFPFTTSGEVAMLHPIRDGVPVTFGAPGPSGRWFISNIYWDGRDLANSCGVLHSPQQPDAQRNVRYDSFKGLYGLALLDVQDALLENIQFLDCNIAWRLRSAAMVTAKRVNIEGSDTHDIVIERQPGNDAASYQFKVDGLHLEPSNVATANRSRTANEATIVTPLAHEMVSGQHVTISGLGGTGYNATNVVVTVVNATTFSYPNTASDETVTADTGGLVQPHIVHISVTDGDGMMFDHVTMSNPNTGTLFDFDVDDGLSGFPIFELRNVEAKAPTTAFNVVHDRQRNITRTTTQIGRRIRHIDSGVNTPNGWAMEITGDASGGNESPPRFANGINLGAGTNVTAGPYVKAGSGSPEGVLSAPIGSIWMRTNGSGVTSIYFKESGASDAGWVNRDSGLVVNTPASSLRNVIQPSADVIGLTVDAFDAGSLQTIFRARKSDGTVVLSVNPNGRVGVGTAGANYPFEVIGQMNVNTISLDDGTAVTGILSGQAELDFDLSAAAVHDLTITVTGAADGDNVILGIPTGSTGAEWDFTQPWVSAANTVKVRARRISGTPNPASGNFKAVIIKW